MNTNVEITELGRAAAGQPTESATKCAERFLIILQNDKYQATWSNRHLGESGPANLDLAEAQRLFLNGWHLVIEMRT